MDVGDSLISNVSSASVATTDQHNISEKVEVENTVPISPKQPVRSNKRNKQPLTVEKTTKIDSAIYNSRNFRHRPSYRVVVIKWISTFLIGAILLGCASLSKVSIVSLSARMHSSINQNDDGWPILYAALMLATLIPQLVNLIRGIFGGLFRKTIPWPRQKSLAAAAVVSLLESIGICLFVFKVPQLTQPGLVVLLMNIVFVLPIVFNIMRSWTSRTNTWMVFFIVAGIGELVGTAVTFYMVIDDISGDMKDIWVPPVAVLCLSVSWIPSVQKYLLKTSNTDDSNNGAGDHAEFEETGYQAEAPSGSGSMSYQTISELPSDSAHVSINLTPNPSNPDTSPERPDELNVHGERPTWKLTIYMSFLKLIFTCTGCLLIFRFYINGETSIEAFNDGWNNFSQLTDTEVFLLVTNIIGALIGYLMGYIACTTCMQRWAFALPLFLSTPLELLLLELKEPCNYFVDDETICADTDQWYLIAIAAVSLLLASGLSAGWLLIRSQSIVMQKEGQLFWTPMYNSVLLEQWLMLVRRSEHTDELHEDPIAKAKRSNVFMCTTMYREADYEMRQVLESIQSLNLAQSEGQRHFESHVFFDGAVKDRNPTEFVLQLVSLVESTLGVKAENCSKVTTPYGMSLTWRLNADEGKRGMIFKIHLKDNFKVKNKKRWSQVMYMSYVLDFLMGSIDGANEEETYILTTDADVRFTPDDVEALLDLMTRDQSVGAVCARTHPLGSGPMVWYQVFEYAIGHWFQKAAEHVIGSVLCSPGCFSVYRCKALKDILPKYASNVEHAFDFLTKDMGEDRWLCTLMVQSGWRIEYCAASENSTHCPEEFDEFYKQRRRWVASTLANLMLLIKEWNIIAKLNDRVSILFLIYQAILLVATLIGPSAVILVVSGGLVYGWGVDSLTMTIIQVLACVGFCIVCLTTSMKIQLNVAKLLTFIYAIVMTSVAVGVGIQIAEDFQKPAPDPDDEVDGMLGKGIDEENFNYTTTTVYICGMTGVFFVTGLLHLGEFVYLLHGIWYLLCLPSGYLILLLYSICNITDRSWGTREVKTHSVVSQRQNWQETLKRVFKFVFFCCFKQEPEVTSIAVQTDSPRPRPTTSRHTSLSEGAESMQMTLDPDHTTAKDISGSVGPDDMRYRSVEGPLSIIDETPYSLPMPEDNEDDAELDSDTIIDVKDWLPRDIKQHANKFIDHGFENTMFLSGMTEKELKDIGIKRKGMKRYLLEEIKKLPDYEIQADVPENVDTWLDMIGLSEYKANFRREQIKTSKDMEVLKSFGRNEIEKELKIKKIGHIKRLLYGIRKLRNPTSTERAILEVKKSIDVAAIHKLRSINIEEYEFWERLKNHCLLPQSTAYGLEEDLKSKLGDLRNAWLVIFAISNVLWLFLIMTLANRGKLLTVFGDNAVGIVVLSVFSVVLIFQFLAMIIHRVETLTHYLARAPYWIGQTFNTSWAFSDSDMSNKPGIGNDDFEAVIARNQARRQAYRRIKEGKKTYRGRQTGERTPLMASAVSDPL